MTTVHKCFDRKTGARIFEFQYHHTYRKGDVVRLSWVYDRRVERERRRPDSEHCFHRAQVNGPEYSPQYTEMNDWKRVPAEDILIETWDKPLYTPTELNRRIVGQLLVRALRRLFARLCLRFDWIRPFAVGQRCIVNFAPTLGQSFLTCHFDPVSVQNHTIDPLLKCCWTESCRDRRNQLRLFNMARGGPRPCFICGRAIESSAEFVTALVLWNYHTTQQYHHKAQHGTFIDPMVLEYDKSGLLLHGPCAAELGLDCRSASKIFNISSTRHLCLVVDDDHWPTQLPPAKCLSLSNDLSSDWVSDVDLAEPRPTGGGFDLSD